MPPGAKSLADAVTILGAARGNMREALATLDTTTPTDRTRTVTMDAQMLFAVLALAAVLVHYSARGI